MVQELNSNIKKNRAAIIGAGPAGCIAAYFLQNDFDVTLFDYGSPLRTLLPTGGGRCNLAHCEYDFRELVKYYPRGEKFLYSLFSKFCTADTIDFFNSIGVETYVQEDMRVFPISDSSKDVREKFLSALKKSNFKREMVLRVDKDESNLKIVTDSDTYRFDNVIISIGGHASYNIIKYLGHNLIEPKQALVGLKTKENFKSIAGVSLKNVTGRFKNKTLTGDIIFTHEGVSGPLVYKISSIMAREKLPYNITFDFSGEIDLQTMLNDSSQKDIKNILSGIVPKSFAVYILNKLGISENQKAHKINGKMRDDILALLNNFAVTVIAPAKDGEVVTCGGVDLAEVNPKTLESKLVKGVYFCGEVLDIDGFCGGFNLQNCWSTGFVSAQAIKQSLL